MKSSRVAVLFTGGKDSTLSLLKAIEAGLTPVILVTLIPENQASWMFHYPCVKLTTHQAESLQLPLHQAYTSGVKDVELQDLEDTLRNLKEKYHFEGLVSGGVASLYQKTRIDAICKKLGLESITPLWGINPEALLIEILNRGFEVVFVGASAEGFTQDWLGRTLDESALADMKRLNQRFGIHLALEGGEGETFVLDCPLFKKRIRIVESERIWQRDAGYLNIKRVELIPKNPA